MTKKVQAGVVGGGAPGPAAGFDTTTQERHSSAYPPDGGSLLFAV